MMRLRIGIGTLIVVILVRLFLTYGTSLGIKAVSKDSKKVIVETTSLIQQNSRNYEAYTQRGDAEFALLRTKSAIQDYTTALSIMPSAKLYDKRANAYGLQGEVELAEKDRTSARNFH